MYPKCIPHIDKIFVYILHTNLASIVFLFGVQNVYKCLSKCGILLYAFWIHFVSSVLYILYKFCIQNVYTVSVRVSTPQKIAVGMFFHAQTWH